VCISFLSPSLCFSPSNTHTPALYSPLVLSLPFLCFFFLHRGLGPTADKGADDNFRSMAALNCPLGWIRFTYHNIYFIIYIEVFRTWGGFGGGQGGIMGRASVILSDGYLQLTRNPPNNHPTLPVPPTNSR